MKCKRCKWIFVTDEPAEPEQYRPDPREWHWCSKCGTIRESVMVQPEDRHKMRYRIVVDDGYMIPGEYKEEKEEEHEAIDWIEQ